ncbi:NAD(P)-dependent dehydrogenase (short-subunit alcohol dehydrogenase family) [Nocardioides thalensis]|uniref:NAD(P)-dependent dehydrogenase (Short-subunit alcohol dehydrogenase family) n=1 Tax=Nocardioides thalensis TaxID=1914755 RepID=A0A853C288_9ACTN|nr:NAD(P)-dependent dehydrogenase (short-subunit alcohol dehydrogenase family) [Nocardioides thalensis]
MRPWTEVPPQPGRHFVITGANSGVGFEAARILASRGARITLACRSLDRGAEAARRMPGHDNGRIAVRRLDVSSLASVREFAGELVAAGEPVDVLVNNAGILGVPFGLSADGVELHFATNHLGHFALTNLLLPHLRDRVVVTSSRNHHGAVLDLDDLAWERRKYGAFPAYGASKLANLLFLAELHRRLEEAGSPVRAVGTHPGATASHIAATSAPRWAAPVIQWGQELVSMPGWRGALNTVYAATMDVPGNTYIGPHGRFRMHGWPAEVGRSRQAEDADLARRLWEVSEELSGVGFPL